MKRKDILSYVLLLFGVFWINSCQGIDDANIVDAEGDTYITVSLRGANEDNILFEDRVNEVRLLAFDSKTGRVHINERIYFPDGLDKKSESILLRTGVYNFYVIANEISAPRCKKGAFESSGITTLSEALSRVSHESDLTTMPELKMVLFEERAQYENPKIPSKERGFLMSSKTDASGLTLVRNVVISKGGTIRNPQPLESCTNGKVMELVRNSAKISIELAQSPAARKSNIVVKKIQIARFPLDYSLVPITNPYDEEDWGLTFEVERVTLHSYLPYKYILSGPQDNPTVETVSGVNPIFFYVPEYIYDGENRIFMNITIGKLGDDSKNMSYQVSVGEAKPSEFSILRNQSLNYNILVKALPEAPESQLIVLPWTNRGVDVHLGNIYLNAENTVIMYCRTDIGNYPTLSPEEAQKLKDQRNPPYYYKYSSNIPDEMISFEVEEPYKSMLKIEKISNGLLKLKGDQFPEFSARRDVYFKIKAGAITKRVKVRQIPLIELLPDNPNVIMVWPGHELYNNARNNMGVFDKTPIPTPSDPYPRLYPRIEIYANDYSGAWEQVAGRQVDESSEPAKVSVALSSSSCENLGYGWRMPTILELKMIYQAWGHYRNKSDYLNTKPNPYKNFHEGYTYWSRTIDSYKDYYGRMGVVDIQQFQFVNNAQVPSEKSSFKDSVRIVRCVRDYLGSENYYQNLWKG